MNRVLKYATGDEIPEGAQFLSTQVERTRIVEASDNGTTVAHDWNKLVWHYFLVKCDVNGNPPPTREHPSSTSPSPHARQ